MSGLKRTSKAVLLIEPTALHALRITSRLRGSAVETWPAGRQPHSTIGGPTVLSLPPAPCQDVHLPLFNWVLSHQWQAPAARTDLGLPQHPQQPHLSRHLRRWSLPAPSLWPGHWHRCPPPHFLPRVPEGLQTWTPKRVGCRFPVRWGFPPCWLSAASAAGLLTS